MKATIFYALQSYMRKRKSNPSFSLTLSYLYVLRLNYIYRFLIFTRFLHLPDIYSKLFKFVEKDLRQSFLSCSQLTRLKILLYGKIFQAYI